MRRLGLRLALAGEGAARWGSALTVLAAVLGTTGLLLLLSVGPALETRADRFAWTTADFGSWADPAADADGWVTITDDNRFPDRVEAPDGTVAQGGFTSYVGDDAVTVVELGHAGLDAPVPPGVDAIPAPGEAYYSPALVERLAEVGQAERYGADVGRVDAGALRYSDDLVAVRGVTPTDAHLAWTTRVTGYDERAMARPLVPLELLVFATGVGAVLAVVVVLVLTAIRLTETTRRRRTATLVLLGADTRAVARIAEGEALLPGVAGALGGLGAFLAVRPLVARIGYEDAQFYASDLWPGWVGVITSLGLILGACLVGARGSVRDLDVDPLGLTRSPERRPRPWRWAGLLLITTPALALLGVPDEMPVVAASMGAAVLGLLVVAPVVVQVLGRLAARGRSAASILGGRRLAAHARTHAGPLAPLIIATLLAPFFAALVPAAATSIDDEVVIGQNDLTAVADVVNATKSESAALADDLREVDGVERVARVAEATLVGPVQTELWVGDCAEITAAGHLDVPCVTGSMTLDPSVQLPDDDPPMIEPRAALDVTTDISGTTAEETWFEAPSEVARADFPAGVDMRSGIVARDLDAADAPVRATQLFVAHGPGADVEQMRTLVEQSTPGAHLSTRTTSFNGLSELLRHYYSAVKLLALALAVAAVLAAAIGFASAQAHRGPADAMLHATGIPTRTLARASAIETALPAAVLACASGIVGSATAVFALHLANRPVPWVDLGLWTFGAPVAAATTLGAVALMTTSRAPAGRRHD
ncbi:FtsX-like permease family protein [Paraoerskovia marina]|uniref:FtsX-like permease family protein n=1 Tax=Paraoerskovia marina TaxID=545619 RepID=A0A1H1PKW2_9CELL|nr:FtsX-like permease family protein [Paraoerskovia marina]SDS11727.1 FtsX-like permease family protein [Paraoerskovia marina]